ncbi:bacteriocin-processing peptidase. Cysteine peptidase. MEROPS family C39 [Chitinophaga sp. CF118]|uniref:peptidase domain-containing ABC transporter n=1 Tax=Chitinophaga sp. CF118 TaxID=1884367 RepID=UPI0008EBF71A|nr:peptidase domain-containing ABC transporter [Chitinophaga sp. CF118]SFF09470.1 bacteriocin-processing peptidase. Cysteine peptidase. MEROPS family C39 [Chitinophaga sp. CF118]
MALFSKKYKFYKQLDYMDCGPTCLRMIAAYYGEEYSLDYLRANSYITKNGVSLLGLSEAAEKIGFKTLSAKLTYDQLTQQIPLPCVLHWNQEHYVVLYGVEKKSFFRPVERIIIADPGHNLVRVERDVFEKCWISSADKKGIALLMEPTPEFYRNAEEVQTVKSGFGFLMGYLRPYKRYFAQLILGMLLASLISMCFPFLTQSLVDFGVSRKNMNFIYLILLSQLLLFLGGIAVDLIRNWILLHISTRISISIISNFLIKLMKLPINFFESKNVGDITQRINDHRRIESFLTGSTLSTLFSIINLFVFSFVLSLYNTKLLLVFAIGSALSIFWISIFLKRRKNIDYNRFQRSRENQNSLFEIITGMQEIKLYNSQKARRWEWERIQAKLFKVNIKSLALEQYQGIGASFFTQLKNIVISYLAAKLVIEQQITLGVMLSISYIVGQMNSPLDQIISFIKSVQDAKISLDRLNEIHSKPEEETSEDLIGYNENKWPREPANSSDSLYLSHELFTKSIRKNSGDGITISNLSFRYGAPKSPLVLKNVSMHIPRGKVTAIVGASGSGKTTLLKLLLKFYPPSEGQILIDEVNLQDISAQLWRNNVGTVMQDGFVFSDSIARNIAVDGERIQEEKLYEAVRIANMHDFISKLPLGFTTRIGNSGSGLSGGQKQRLFIARAVYKDAKYLFFDEATSALDANNEKVIMQNLNQFYKGRTVVVIAHRLSTVKNADQIIVMKDGEVVEEGHHSELTRSKGYYFELVKNQLELDVA